MLYFDHNATTFLAPEVASALASAQREIFGNPSSTHRAGQAARQQLETSRSAVAQFLNATPAELVFTSGGTESNNLAILGLVRSFAGERKHVITSTIEHPSVLECARQLAREGVEISYVNVDRAGIVDPGQVERNLRPETVLVSLMHANNETGVLQPIERIGQVIHDCRQNGQTIFFHCDGVQAFGKIPVDMQELGVDLYSVSAHKIFGPKGVGALYVRKSTPLRGIQYGGHHERERRAGTENVPGVMAFARAVELCETAHAISLSGLRDRFEAELLASLPDIEINGARESRLPNTSNVLFPAVSAEALVIALDMRGIAVSTGSACSSGSVEPSHVLLAMGRTREEARASARFSFGRYNTAGDVAALTEAVIACVNKIRRATPLERRVAV